MLNIRPSIRVILSFLLTLMPATVYVGQAQTGAAEEQNSDDPESEIEDEEVYILEDFVVSSDQDEGYYSANTTSVSRINSLAKNTPISMSIVNDQLLADLNITSTEELALVNAAIDEDPNGFSLDRVRIRGFRSSFSRYNFFQRNLPSDSYNVARVDVIKGANSLIFGQASPGGTINSVPVLANFRGNTGSVMHGVGNKNYERTVFNVNQIINDKLALRLMGVSNERGFDHPLKEVELRGVTLAATVRFNRSTQLRLHLEGIDTFNRFPLRAMRDRTRIDDDNDPNNRYRGILSASDFSSSITDYQVPFSPDWVDYLPGQALDWIIDRTRNNGNPITSRQDLKDHYSLINADNYGSVTGPDRFSQRDGIFFMGDLDHKFTDKIYANLALNYQVNKGNNLGRNVESAVLVRDSYEPIFSAFPRPDVAVGDQFIRTFWQRNESETDRFTSRSSLVFEGEWGKLKNLLILGWDFSTRNRQEAIDDQVPVGAVGAVFGGTPLPDGAYIPMGRFGEGTHTTRQFRAYEYISLSRGFSPSRSILRFNEIIETDILPLPSFDNRNHLAPAEWALSRTADSRVTSNGFWFANQSDFFDGRLHTLLGLRYDTIDVDSAFRRVFLHGFDTGSDDENNESEGTYDELNPTLGGLFWLTDQVGVFANYARSIEIPSGTERTPLGVLAPPELGEGYEAGIRFNLFTGKLDGQLAFYRIIKENDNEFAYSNRLLGMIYPFDEFGAEYPELFNARNQLDFPNLPGRRGVGDKTRSDGFEVDMTYNPLPGLSFIVSYNYTIANEIEELHESVSNPGDFELFGRPDHRATITGRYQFMDGPLKGLALGASHRFRSASIQTRFDLHYDADGNVATDDSDIARTDRVYLKFGDEHTTSLFATWTGKISKRRGAPILNLAFRVNNLFDDDEFTGRENYGFYREGLSYNVSAKLKF